MSGSGSDSALETLDRLYDDPEDRLATLLDSQPEDEVVDGQQAVFKALANEHRLRILEALRDGERCACELQAILEVPQSTAATHLRELKDADLVKTRQKGKWTYYRIGDTAVLQLLDIAKALRAGQR